MSYAQICACMNASEYSPPSDYITSRETGFQQQSTEMHIEINVPFFICYYNQYSVCNALHTDTVLLYQTDTCHLVLFVWSLFLKQSTHIIY